MKGKGKMEITHHNAIEKYLSGEISCGEAIKIMRPRTNEILNRIWKICETGYHYAEHEPMVKSWLTQWCNHPELDMYKAYNTNLLVSGATLFLIPTDSCNKPIRLIKAKAE